jgi:hypothetical protein
MRLLLQITSITVDKGLLLSLASACHASALANTAAWFPKITLLFVLVDLSTCVWIKASDLLASTTAFKTRTGGARVLWHGKLVMLLLKTILLFALVGTLFFIVTSSSEKR